MKRSEAIVSLRSLIDPLGQNIPVFLETIRWTIRMGTPISIFKHVFAKNLHWFDWILQSSKMKKSHSLRIHNLSNIAGIWVEIETWGWSRVSIVSIGEEGGLE
jgi:hypothetical protein